MTGVNLKVRAMRDRINRAVEMNARVVRHKLQEEADILSKCGYEEDELLVLTDICYEVPCRIVTREISPEANQC